jgi:hypothetical protein
MTSTQQVDVEMKHRLPRSRTHVEHGAVSLLDVPLACNLSRCEVTAADHFGVFGPRFLQSSKMFLRNNQHVRGSLWVDVFKGQYVLVLVNFLGGNFAAENAAEKAVAFGLGHRLVTMPTHSAGNDNT